MRQFIFCHGFGFDKSFWQNLTPFFLKEKCNYLDLGYFSHNPSELKFKREEKQLIGIGHSLGLIKLLNMSEKFDFLIGLNSFINFLGNAPRLNRQRKMELLLIKKQLALTPLQTLKKFYHRGGLSVFAKQMITKKINLTTLLTDLNLLAAANALPKQTPTLIIGALNDPVVPSRLIADNFANYSNVKLELIKTGKHGLGFLKAATIHKKIKDFIR